MKPLIAAALLLPAVALAAPLEVKVQQGGVGRWTGLAAKDCGIFGKRYPAVDAVCYYPIDLQAKVGRHEIAVYDQDGKQHLATLEVEAVDFPKIDITLPDDTYVKVSEADLARHTEERKRVLALFGREVEAPRFSLPLAKPAGDLPDSENDFGSLRVFNGTREGRHTGRDAPVAAGTPVKAVEDGTVLLAEDQFFTGNTVFVDHGGGLISMNFHMSELAVKTGDEVKRGDTLGKVGSTGRSTGPHLHLGFRWNGARIDPYLLLESPNKLPTVGEAEAKSEQKIEAAVNSEPQESGEEEG